MGKINGWRVVLGGLLAGLVLSLEQGVVNGGILKDTWAAMASKGLVVTGKELEGARFVVFLATMAGGIILAWFYAAMRPRLGAGLRTSMLVGLMAWLFMFFMSHVPAAVMMPSMGGWAVTSGLGDLFGYLIAASVAGWVYREGSDKAATAPARKRR